MIPTYVELELELHQTKAELVQTRELLKRAIEEIHKLGDEVTKLKEQISKNSKKQLQASLFQSKSEHRSCSTKEGTKDKKRQGSHSLPSRKS